MEEKEIQPTIQMKNSSIVIVKNSASIIFGLFFILLFFARPFRKSKCSECKNERRKRLKRRVKGLPFWKAFYSSSYSYFLPSVPVSPLFSNIITY